MLLEFRQWLEMHAENRQFSNEWKDTFVYVLPMGGGGGGGETNVINLQWHGRRSKIIHRKDRGLTRQCT